MCQGVLFFKVRSWMLSGNDNDNNNNTASIQLTHWTGLMTEFDLTTKSYSLTSSLLWPTRERLCVTCIYAFQNPSISVGWLSLHPISHSKWEQATERARHWWMCESVGVASTINYCTSISTMVNSGHRLRIFCFLFCFVELFMFYFTE